MGDYTNFYLGSTTVAGALAGLLFVSLSVAPQRLSGPAPRMAHNPLFCLTPLPAPCDVRQAAVAGR